MAYGAEGKRKPLSVLIGLEASKLRGKDGTDRGDGDSEDADEAPEEYGKEEGVAAAQDMIDAMKTRDAVALNEALAKWCEIYGHGEKD